MTIYTENMVFDWRVAQIVNHSREIESAAHLFDRLSDHIYDTALDKLDLRQSATRLREAADKLDDIATRLQGPAMAFPDMLQAAE